MMSEAVNIELWLVTLESFPSSVCCYSERFPFNDFHFPIYNLSFFHPSSKKNPQSMPFVCIYTHDLILFASPGVPDWSCPLTPAGFPARKRVPRGICHFDSIRRKSREKKKFSPRGFIHSLTVTMSSSLHVTSSEENVKKTDGLNSSALIDLEHHYGAHNYHPLPVVFDRAAGCKVWDPEGTEYIDCLSAYSAVNQGHCHPKILKSLIDQSTRLTLSSRAFYSSSLGPYLKKLCSTFGYERALPMNTGVEAVETALKLARKWAYVKKGVPQDKAIIMSADGNFHGRTLGVIGMSTDPESRNLFGPFLETIGSSCPVKTTDKSDTRLIRYNNFNDLERALQAHGTNTAAVLIEPIQGEAGVVVPDDDYLPRVKALCERHNVLLILDEVQTGLGRTGKLLCQHHSNVRADITTLGKALSGGFYPVSAVLADEHIMGVIKPGEHGSTFGGNPLACAVATAALDVLIEENLSERAEKMGQLMRDGLLELKSIGPSATSPHGYIQTVRGKGLLNAIVIDPSLSPHKRGAWELCLLMKSRGVLAKPTHSNIIRLAPPLVIQPDEVQKVIQVMKECLKELDQVDQILE